MGYELHITKKEDWSEDGLDITTDEWINIVKNDPELSIDNKNGSYFAIWKPAGIDAEYWLDWFEGNICSKYPEPALIQKMIEIAKLLNAKVQGDDGEIYDDHTVLPEKAVTEKKKSWIDKIFRR
jgi:hypothetical protein